MKLLLNTHNFVAKQKKNFYATKVNIQSTKKKKKTYK